ncbi:hypothetical protein GCM10023196_035910 [Actinoallomurus vinaceus]|uniref:Uncharacterized protein n=1 Tax=Actinoallomurus vinaceus TaxID=1080074 RepID=A0ABP8U8Y3_9ACTN
MTAPDLDTHGERAARELARRLEPVTTLKDPYAFALRFIQDLKAEHWHHIEPPPPVIAAAGTGAPPDPHADELDAARQACARASDKFAAKATPTRKDHP